MAGVEGGRLSAGRPSRLDQYLLPEHASGAAGTTTSQTPATTTATSGGSSQYYATSRTGMKRAHSTSSLDAAPRRIIRHTRYIRSGSTEPAHLEPPALLGFICTAESHRRASSSSRRLSAGVSTESLPTMDGGRRSRRGSSQDSTCSNASVCSVGGRPVKTKILGGRSSSSGASSLAALPRRGAKLVTDVAAPWKDAEKADHAPHVVAAPKLPPIGAGASRITMLGSTRVSTGYLDRVVKDIPHHLEELERQLGIHSSMPSASSLHVKTDRTEIGAHSMDLDLEEECLTPSGSLENLLTEEELSHVTSAIAGNTGVTTDTKSPKAEASHLLNLDERYKRIIASPKLAKSRQNTEREMGRRATGVETNISGVITTEQLEEQGAAATTTGGTPDGVVDTIGQMVAMETGVSPPGGRMEDGGEGVIQVEEARISAAGLQPSTPPPPPPPHTSTTPSQADSLTLLTSKTTLSPTGVLETEINDALEVPMTPSEVTQTPAEVTETPIEVEVIPEVNMESPVRNAGFPVGTPSPQQEGPVGPSSHPSGEEMDLSVLLPESVLSAYERYNKPEESISVPSVGGDHSLEEDSGDDRQRPLEPEAEMRAATPSGGVDGKERDARSSPSLPEAVTSTELTSVTAPNNTPTTISTLEFSSGGPGVEKEAAVSLASQEEQEEAKPGNMEPQQNLIKTEESHSVIGNHIADGIKTAGTKGASETGEKTDIVTDSLSSPDPNLEVKVTEDKDKVKVTSSPDKPRLRGILKKTSSYEVSDTEYKEFERKFMGDDESKPSDQNVKDTGVIEIKEGIKDHTITPIIDDKIEKDSKTLSDVRLTQHKLDSSVVAPSAKPAASPEVKVVKTEISKTQEEQTKHKYGAFPTLSDVMSIKSFDPSALDVQMRLIILDVIINFLLFTPLTVLFYHSTSRLLELSLLRMLPHFGAWILFLIGAAIEFSASFWQRTLLARAPKPAAGRPPFADVNIPFLLASKGYNFLLGFGNVCHMIAMTSLVDLYVGPGYDVSLRTALTSLVVLWTLRCGRNVMAPPLYVGIDADDLKVFASTTMFKVEPDLSAESLADILGTVGVVMSFVHLHWAGVWNCADAIIFPSSFGVSMVVSLILGSAICILFMLLQQAAMDISRNLEREKKEPLRIAFENVFITGANVGVILLWRGLWMVYDIMADYFPIYCRSWDVTPLAGCILSFLLLALAHCSSSVLYQGCEIDGEVLEGKGVSFTNGYFTEILNMDDNEVKHERLHTKISSQKSLKKPQTKPITSVTKKTITRPSPQAQSPNGTTKATSPIKQKNA